MSAQRVDLKPVVAKLRDADNLCRPEAMRPQGECYEAEIPDTLDLAERAELAINALANLRPADCYAVTQSFCFGRKPPWVGPPNWLTVKFLRALPLMRAMCGSEQNLEVECRAMRAVLGQIREDGLLYCPIAGDGPPANTSYPLLSGVAAQSMLNWWKRDGNPAWMAWLQVLWAGLGTALVDRGDYAYIPPECSLSADGTWHWTLRGTGNAPGYIPYTPPEEPVHDSQGQEGAVKFEQASSLKALVQCCLLTGDENALRQARKLARFCLKPALWNQDTADESAPPHEHGIWTGHLHGNLTSLDALLHLALADHDHALMQVVREGYEHARRHGVIRLGFMPGWIKPLVGRPKCYLEQNEGCGVADTLALAVQLTDAGLGDYWDDVDAIVRNHFIELQITDLERMRQAMGGCDHYDEVLRGFLGGFIQAELTMNTNSGVYGCCTGNGARALYTAWESITRFGKGLATVNLLLNRASPWMDIDSYLPHEGRVVLHNKQAHTAAVRIPGWISSDAVTWFINDRPIMPPVAGRYAVLAGLRPGDVIRHEFPLPQTRECYTIGDTAYTVTFRGSTVVDLSPRATDIDEHAARYPFFLRSVLKSGKTPLKRVTRFVAKQIVADRPWEDAKV